MKTMALALAAAACGAAILMAADEKPAAADTKPAAPQAGEEEAEAEKPKGPRYRVIGAMGTAQPPVVAGEGINPNDPAYLQWDKRRKTLEEALNKADADGYRVAGMNNDWVILERRDPPARRRVVLPTQ